MPQILTESNFQVDVLENLYREIVIVPYGGQHNSQTNQQDASDFFNRNVKPIFQVLFDRYSGVNDNKKSLAIIEEIRGNILDKIITALNDESDIELYNIPSRTKTSLRILITINKNSLVQQEYNCATCQCLRNIILQIIEDNSSLINHPLLGAWRFLDPQNDIISINASYYCFSYGHTNELGPILHIYNTPISTVGPEEISTKVLTAIAFYYLATKYNCSQTLLPELEQQDRFGRYIGTLTEALRGYNLDGNAAGPDISSCYGGTISRLIEQCGFEDSIRFMSRKTFVVNAVNAVVTSKVEENLSRATTADDILNIQRALLPGFSINQELLELQHNRELLHKRYSFFTNDNNNNNHHTEFFRLIIAEMLKIRNIFANSWYHRVLMDSVLFAIRNIDYATFREHFENFSNFYFKEVNLIGYALSDPAYGCYSEVVNQCNKKLKELFPSQQLISDQEAQELAAEIVGENLLNNFASNGNLWQHNYGLSYMSVIISSYKNTPFENEDDEAFINRIKGMFYVDSDGNTEGLGTIINENLPNRAVLIENIANRILEKIRIHQGNVARPALPNRTPTRNSTRTSISAATLAERDAAAARQRERRRQQQGENQFQFHPTELYFRPFLPRAVIPVWSEAPRVIDVNAIISNHQLAARYGL